MLGAGSGKWVIEPGAEEQKRLMPKHLFEKREARDKSKLRAYNQILGQIQARIYHTSQLPGNTSSLMYTVPPFILGLPSIDLEDCIVYLVTMLRSNGFQVNYTYPNLLAISWRHYEAEYNRQQNPIVKAMMATQTETTSKKGKEGNRGTGGAGGAGVRFAPNERLEEVHHIPRLPGQAPPRSAAEYRPPDAFMETLTRPAPRPPSQAPGNAIPGVAPRTSSDVLSELWKFT